MQVLFVSQAAYKYGLHNIDLFSGKSRSYSAAGNQERTVCMKLSASGALGGYPVPSTISGSMYMVGNGSQHVVVFGAA